MSLPTSLPPQENDSPPKAAQPQAARPRWSLWRGLASQAGVVLLVAAALIGYKAADATLDSVAVRSVGIATAIVGVSGAVALVISSLAASPQQAATMVLAGMLVRLFVPLAALVVISKRWPELEDAGFREQILILYLAALAIETYAAIRVTGMPPPRFTVK